MTIVGKGLGMLDRYHGRLTGLDDGKPQQAAWMKSMRATATESAAARCSTA